MISSDVKKIHGFYISIDDIFDTRLTVLESIDEQQTSKLLMEGYFSRERDDFPGIDLYEFRKRYQERNIVTLANSKMTSLMFHLGQTIGNYSVEMLAEGKTCELKIILNTYPYQLDKEALNDFVTCLKIRTKNIAPVEVIHKPLDRIYPSWLEDNVCCFYCYGWDEWLGHHKDDLVKKRLDSVQLLAPRIMPLSYLEGQKQMKEFEESAKDIVMSSEMNEYIEELESSDMNAFKLIEDTVSSYAIGFHFIDTREYCTFLPDSVPTPPGQFVY